jgi:hypothetical protein
VIGEWRASVAQVRTQGIGIKPIIQGNKIVPSLVIRKGNVVFIGNKNGVWVERNWTFD